MAVHDMKGAKILASFRQGTGPMAMNALDFYEKDGNIIEHSWAMGGSSLRTVEKVPDKIEGYHRQNAAKGKY